MRQDQKVGQKDIDTRRSNAMKPVCKYLFKVAGLVVILSLFAFISEARAGSIYSYVDKNGVWHFSNVPTDTHFTRMEFTSKSATLYGTSRHKHHNRNAIKKTYHSVVKKAAKSYGLDPGLVKAVIEAESGWNPYAVSPKGALGLMQLMPDTAQELMVYDPLDPEENIWGGSHYLSMLLEMFNGDVINALAAYNAGPGAVTRYGGLPPYRETVNYVQRVLKFWKRSN